MKQFPDKGLGPQVRPFEDTFSAATVLKEMFFPHTLTDKEKLQIGPERTAEAERRATLKRGKST